MAAVKGSGEYQIKHNTSQVFIKHHKIKTSHLPLKIHMSKLCLDGPLSGYPSGCRWVRWVGCLLGVFLLFSSLLCFVLFFERASCVWYLSSFLVFFQFLFSIFLLMMLVLRFTSPFSCSVFFIKFCKASHAFIKIQKIKTPPTPKELHVYLKCIDSPLGDTPPATDGRDEFCTLCFGLRCFYMLHYVVKMSLCR